jgi:hypothetical protein
MEPKYRWGQGARATVVTLVKKNKKARYTNGGGTAGPRVIDSHQYNPGQKGRDAIGGYQPCQGQGF